MTIGTWVIPTLICVAIFVCGSFFTRRGNTGDFSKGDDAFLGLILLAVELILMLVVWLVWALI